MHKELERTIIFKGKSMSKSTGKASVRHTENGGEICGDRVKHPEK